MKLIFIVAFTVLNILIANAQTTVSTSSTSTSSNSNTGKHTSSRSSISIHESDNSYTLRCDFEREKYDGLKKLLMSNLDSSLMMTTPSGAIRWIKDDRDDTAYTISLADTSLKISVDKKLISKSASEKFKTLGDDISDYISHK